MYLVYNYLSFKEIYLKNNATMEPNFGLSQATNDINFSNHQ